MRKYFKYIISIIVTTMAIFTISYFTPESSKYSIKDEFYIKAEEIYQNFYKDNKDNDIISNKLFIKVDDNSYVIYENNTFIKELYTLEEIKKYFKVNEMEELIDENGRTITYQESKIIKTAFYKLQNYDDITFVYESIKNPIEFRLFNGYLEWKYSFEGDDLWKKVLNTNDMYDYINV